MFCFEISSWTMEDKLKRYEKIEFLGEGQVSNILQVFFKYIW